MIEEQVQQLTAKLQDIEMEKRSLIARNKVLEAALSSAKDAKVCAKSSRLIEEIHLDTQEYPWLDAAYQIYLWIGFAVYVS